MMDELPTIKLEFGKRKIFAHILQGVFLLLTGICILLLPPISGLYWFRVGGFALFFGLGVAYFIGLSSRPKYIELTNQGIKFRDFYSMEFIKWVEIAEFKEYKLQGERRFGINYVPERKRSVLKVAGVQYDDWMGNPSALKFDEFRDLVISYWSRAKQVQALELSKQAVNLRLKTD